MQGWNRQTLAFPTGAAEGSSSLVTRAADGSPSPNQHPAWHAGPFHVVEDIVDVVVDVVGVVVEVGVVVVLDGPPCAQGTGEVILTGTGRGKDDTMRRVAIRTRTIPLNDINSLT